MKIAQILPTTLIDYPDKVSALAYTAGCNFRCPFCHNSELVLPEKIRKLQLIPEDDILYFLREREKFLDALCITGGEPTLHDDLPRFIERVKRLGLLVKLDTNGSHPEVLQDLLNAHLLDYVAMDVKGPPARYDELAGVRVNMGAIERSIKLIIKLAPDYEFRTTVAPTITPEDIEDTVELVQGAKRYFLQTFVVPEGKDLVDPVWSEKTALSEEELRAVWGRIEEDFEGGGVR
jgi:pyruvate formate lyase activating enzyme